MMVSARKKKTLKGHQLKPLETGETSIADKARATKEGAALRKVA